MKRKNFSKKEAREQISIHRLRRFSFEFPYNADSHWRLPTEEADHLISTELVEAFPGSSCEGGRENGLFIVTVDDNDEKNLARTWSDEQIREKMASIISRYWRDS